MPQRPNEKDMGQKMKDQKMRAKDKAHPQRPIRLPGFKQASFKLPSVGKPEDVEKYSKRKVQLIDPKVFRNLNQPQRQVVEGTLKLN